jgi:hypothetical protein
MKIRHMAMGCILSALSGIMICRAFQSVLLGLVAVGVLLLIVGLL